MTTDIWWPSLCGNRTNYDAFWSYDLTLNTDNPDLSVCLQDTILTWVPCGTLFLLSPINIYHLLKQPKQHSWKAFSKINLVKTFAIICLIITSVLALIEGINTTINQTQARLIALILRLITYVTVAIFIRWEYVKGKHTSGVLFLFWLLQVICDIIPFRSLIIRKQIDVEVPEYKQFVLFYISYGLIIIEIITHSISDVKAFGSSNPIRTIQLSEEKIPLIDKNVLRDNPNAQNPIPEMYVPIWQKVTFWWIIPDIFKGYRKPVQMDDLYDLRKEDSCKVLLRHFEQYYRGYVSPKKKYLGSTANYSESHREHNTGQIKKSWQFSFFWSIFLGAGWPATLGTVLQTVCVLCQALYPQILRLLISFIEGGDEDTWKGCMLAFCMLILSFSISILRQNNMYLGYSAGLKVRSVVNSIIYRKAIRLTSAAKKTTTVGEIVNLMAVDSQKLQDVFTFSFLLYQVPLLVVVSTYLIWDTVGNSAFAGLGMLLIILPLNSGYLASKIRKLQNKQMNSKDERIKSMNEILSGIKILKLYAWEPSFQQHLISVREKELVTLKKANILNAISGVFMFLAPYLVSLAIFGVFVLTSSNNILDPDKAFVTLAYINLFNYSLSYLPLSVNYVGQSVVSVQRITKFLDMDELNEDYVEINDQMKDAVCIQEGSFSWKEKDKSILQDVTMRVTRGKLVAVVGQVGSGKSSLLSALLGEMVKSEGTVAINGSVAYVPQQAWIQNATLQNNILFGKPHVNARYDKILKACALKPDLKVLPCGDQTEIGEKGINLSGGQKQRVSLARAMYQDEDIYLLDDPLSAVDAHVGKQLFENVIGPDGMLNHKTRILVTHGITYLPFVDEIFLLRGGVVLESGRYQELLHKQGAFTEFIKNCRIDDEKISYDSDIDTTLVGSPISSVTGSESDTERTRPTPLRRKYRKTISSQSSRESQISIKETQGQEKLIEEELSQVGAIKLSVIWTFVKAGGLVFFVLVVFFQVVFTFTQVVTNIWLSAWTNDVPVNGTSSSTSLWLGVYAGLGVAQAAAILIVLTASAYGCVTASRFLHKQLLETILHAPMVFFDTTPLGRIMNRFSRDIDVIDTQLPILLRSWLFCVSPLVASVVIITYSTPIFLVVLFPLGFIYIMSQRMYIVYAGQLKRYDSVLRSPIYAHFDESITGASSIRAYRRQQEFMDRCDYLIDESQKPYYLLCIAQRCLGILMEFLGGVLIFFATLFAVLQRDSLSSGLVALSVTFALEITNNLIGMVRRSTELETYMVSVERIDEYCKVKPEAPWKIPGEVYPFGWPCKGEIIFKDYATRYRPGLGLVLNNISLTVHPGEKVGVVGRTGAGKSSLSLALFRIIEASSGNITIDGVNIARIGLHDIRARVTIIPQDPVIFSGSLRLNLDPFARYSDDEIWSALQHAHLKPFVTSLREGLDYQCGEGGESLSVGQRQLVCLARALLRKSKILVMDEATAAVDLETDALIQITIKKQFEACTVLTVAHRLNTVMDYDRILVLDKGVIKEFDTPNVLMADKHSVFYGLAKEAGLT